MLDSKASVAALNLNIEKLDKQLKNEQERNQQLHVRYLCHFIFREKQIMHYEQSFV